MTEKQEEKSFFDRWSYRKAMTEEAKTKELKEAALEQQNAPDPQIDNAEVRLQDESAELRQTGMQPVSPEEAEEMEQNHEAAKAVDLETLNYNSDYQVFFKKGVPEHLKNMAMRKLWISNPVLANVDGLNEYDENFADPALNTFKSIWDVGKGYLTDEDKHTPVKEAVSSLADPEEEGADQSTEQDQDESEISTENDLEDEQNEEASEHVETAQNAPSDEQKNQSEFAELSGNEDLEPAVFAEEEEPQNKRVSMRSRLFENE